MSCVCGKVRSLPVCASNVEKETHLPNNIFCYRYLVTFEEQNKFMAGSPILTAITAAYQTYRDAQANSAAANTAITNLGARPIFGGVIATDDEYQDIVDAQTAWGASMETLRAAAAAAADVLRTAEISVINTPNFFFGAWLKLTGLTGGVATVYIGVPFLGAVDAISGAGFPHITTLTTEPTNNFPDETNT